MYVSRSLLISAFVDRSCRVNWRNQMCCLWRTTPTEVLYSWNRFLDNNNQSWWSATFIFCSMWCDFWWNPGQGVLRYLTKINSCRSSVHRLFQRVCMVLEKPTRGILKPHEHNILSTLMTKLSEEVSLLQLYSQVIVCGPLSSQGSSKHACRCERPSYLLCIRPWESAFPAGLWPSSHVGSLWQDQSHEHLGQGL